MDGFLSVLAGGFASVGDAYSRDKESQREFERTQKAQEAEQRRKENFARFKYTIDQDTANEQLGRQKALYDHQDSTKPSGMYDPETKRELTKGELKELGSSEGLVSKLEFESGEKGRLLRQEKDLGRKADLARAEEAYKAGELSKAEFEAIKKSSLGLAISEKASDEMTPKEIKRFKNNLGDDIDDLAKDLSPSGKATPAWTSIAALEKFNKLSKEQQKHAISNPSIRTGIIQNKLADKILEYRDEGLSMEQAREKGIKNKEGKMVPLTKEQFNSVLELLEARGDLIPQDPGISKLLTPGVYKDKW